MDKLRKRQHTNKLYTLILILLIITLLLPVSVYALDDSHREYAQEPLREPEEYDVAEVVDLQFMEEYWREVEQDAEEYFPSLNWREAYRWFQPGEEGFKVQEIPGGIARFFMGELFLNISFMGKLLVLAVVAAFLKNLQSSFESTNVSWITQGVVLIVLIGLILPGFMAAMNMAKQAIDGMVDFILALIPVLLILLASLGSFSTAALFQPVVIFSINFFSSVIRMFIFPLIYFTTALALVHNISPHLKLGKIADFFRDICMLLLGLMITLFIALVCLKGVTGAAGDAITMKTAKFLSGSFIPVIGKMLGDAVETVAGASLLFKNGVGVAGLIILAMIALFPILKLFVLFFIYRAAAALVQVVGESTLGDCLTAMGNSIMLLIATVTGVTLIFLVAVAVVVASGNLTVMLR